MIIKWAVGSVVAVLLAIGIMHFLPVWIDDSPDAALATIALRLPVMLVGAVVLIGITLFVDYITPDDWFEIIAKDPRACATVVAALIISIGLLVAIV